jgi:CheY-like chemotaxis protein
MKRILIVEHSELGRDVLVRRLTAKGFEVLMASNGDEGLHLAEASRPDLILMDLHMPLLDGWECCRRLKASPATRDIALIAVTARARSKDRNRAMETGFDEFETKPVDFTALLTKVEQFPGHLAVGASPPSQTNSSTPRHPSLTQFRPVSGLAALPGRFYTIRPGRTIHGQHIGLCCLRHARTSRTYIDALRTKGFRATDIPVLWPENVGLKDLVHEMHTKAPEQPPAPARARSSAACWAGSPVSARCDSRHRAIHRCGSNRRGVGRRGPLAPRWHHRRAHRIWRPEYEAKRYEGRIRKGGIPLSGTPIIAMAQREGHRGGGGRAGH